MTKKRVSIIGLGYIGLPTAALLANSNFKVLGCDTDHKIVDTINKGKAHFYEPNLDNLLKTGLRKKNLKAYVKPQPADVHLICVPTPLSYENDKPIPNINYVIKAFKSILKILNKNDLVILESTCPVGTTEKLRKIFCTINENFTIKLAYCPERVLPGKTIEELISNDRIVGGINSLSTREAANFYSSFIDGKVLTTNAKTAELSKLVENSFRDVNIAFANELSLICEDKKIDVWELIDLANHHPRVNILSPGVGVGGHCIAVDPWFIVSENKENSKLIQISRTVNDYKPIWVIKKIKDKVKKFINLNKKNPKIVCLGIAFKKDIDDLRGSPAMFVANELVKNNYDVVVVEPNILEVKGLQLVDIEFAIRNGDIFIYLVDHSQFNSENIKSALKKKDLINFCNNDL